MIEHKKTNWIRAGAFWIALGISGVVTAAVNVELKVDDENNPQALVVSKNNAQCAGGPLDCIEVKPGTNPHMFFTLKKACAGVNYRLASFRITQTDKKWPTPEDPMDAAVAKDFCADRTSGYVDFNYCRNDLQKGQMKLKNFNEHAGDVFYEVTAVRCDNPSYKIVLDPRIKNGGGAIN